jgi:ubiquinone/menaquinone biosynthesis C-methylase UbiE
MAGDRRFQGVMSQDYLLLRQAIPDFDHLQGLVAEAVAGYHPAAPAGRTRALDLGCGSGATAEAILRRRPDLLLTALDSEEGMLNQAAANLAAQIQAGSCEVVLQDALGYLQGVPESTFDVVASALVLHNLRQEYRQLLHGQIFRVLKAGGLFVNADKYAGTDEQRIQALQATLGRFFDTFLPVGRGDLLRAAVLHEVADESPDRVMREEDAVRELAGLGFRNVEVRCRHQAAVLLVATKPT